MAGWLSDITVLSGALPSIHGTLYVDQNGELEKRNLELLLGYITGHGAIFWLRTVSGM